MVNTQTIPASASAQDPIARDFTQISAEDPQIRRLTVYYGTDRVRGPDGRPVPVPLLRLQGAWLERAGFATGVPVKVHVSRGRLVIEAAEPERVPKAEVLERIARVSEGGLPKRELDALMRHLKQERID
jgi:Toxin SymE, type I toxin-antitoxin system